MDRKKFSGRAALLEDAPISMQDAYRSLAERHEFQPGDLVEWKPGLKNCKVPDYGEPVMVVELIPGNIDLVRDSGSNHYREPNDIACLVWAFGEYTILHFDQRRLRPYQEPAQGTDESSEG